MVRSLLLLSYYVRHSYTMYAYIKMCSSAVKSLPAHVCCAYVAIVGYDIHKILYNNIMAHYTAMCGDQSVHNRITSATYVSAICIICIEFDINVLKMKKNKKTQLKLVDGN